MLPEAISASVAALLNNIHTWPLPVDTYMAGGTAVAIYLNHRVSVDIDLFTEKEARLDRCEWNEIEEFFKRLILGR